MNQPRPALAPLLLRARVPCRSVLAIGFPTDQLAVPLQFLRSQDIAVTAHSGTAAALDAVQGGQFDVIAVDVENCDQYAPLLIQSLRCHIAEASNRAQIVAYGVVLPINLQEQLRDAGADAILLKRLPPECKEEMIAVFGIAS